MTLSFRIKKPLNLKVSQVVIVPVSALVFIHLVHLHHSRLPIRLMVSSSMWQSMANHNSKEAVHLQSHGNTQCPFLSSLAKFTLHHGWDAQLKLTSCSHQERNVKQKYRHSVLSSYHFLNVEFRDSFNFCSISSLPLHLNVCLKNK